MVLRACEDPCIYLLQLSGNFSLCSHPSHYSFPSPPPPLNQHPTIKPSANPHSTLKSPSLLRAANCTLIFTWKFGLRHHYHYHHSGVLLMRTQAEASFASPDQITARALVHGPLLFQGPTSYTSRQELQFPQLPQAWIAEILQHLVCNAQTLPNL